MGTQAAAPLRVPHLLGLHSMRQHLGTGSQSAVQASVHTALLQSSAHPSAPVVVYISKMVAMPASQLPR